jgi:hypothetical protein
MKPKLPLPTLFALLGLVTAVACGKAPTPAASEPAAKPDVALAGSHESAKPGVAAEVTGLTGTVLETMDAAGYTYLKLKTAEGETWAAINETKVAKGSTVTVVNPMPMDGFESKTLKRKFDHIVFGTLAGAPGASGAPAAIGGSAGSSAPGGMGGPAVPPAMAAQHAAAASGPEVTEKISVAKAEGADGRTIAELFSQRAALKGKTVAVRGKVVKYNDGIMGRNWIHLRDGSGTRAMKDDDVTVTTNDTVAKGDVVLVVGTVGLDRDFGAGYTYTVVIEGAKVTK